MSTQTKSDVHSPFPKNRGHQRPVAESCTSSATWIHVPAAQKLEPNSGNSSTPWVHSPTIITPKDLQVFDEQPGSDPETTTSKKRARVDSGVSLSSISSLFKIHHLKGSKPTSRSSTITSKSSVCSTTNITVSSISTAPEESTVQPKKVKFAAETETQLERFHRQPQARHKVINDQIRAHRGKERARNQRAEEMLRVCRQHKKMSEKKLRKAVRENMVMDKGTRMMRFKRWVRGVFIGDHKRGSQ